MPTQPIMVTRCCFIDERNSNGKWDINAKEFLKILFIPQLYFHLCFNFKNEFTMVLSPFILIDVSYICRTCFKFMYF